MAVRRQLMEVAVYINGGTFNMTGGTIRIARQKIAAALYVSILLTASLI